jgi:hypothetical protein
MRGPNGPAPRWIPDFPSETHYNRLKAQGFERRVLDVDLWAWMAYGYAWRRVWLQGGDDDVLPLDEGTQWFNASLVAQAQAFFHAKKFNRRSRRR